MFSIPGDLEQQGRLPRRVTCSVGLVKHLCQLFFKTLYVGMDNVILMNHAVLVALGGNEIHLYFFVL